MLDGLTDAELMGIALEKAEQAQKNGEVPVGAVLVKEGKVIASAGNAVIGLCDPSAHAEIQVLRLAGQLLGNYRLPGCELFVTLEPCAMCAAAMIHARISRVVFGAPDPKTGAAGGLFNLFETTFNHQTQVVGGVLTQPCGDILKAFFRAKRTQSRGFI